MGTFFHDFENGESFVIILKIGGFLNYGSLKGIKLKLKKDSKVRESQRMEIFGAGTSVTKCTKLNVGKVSVTQYQHDIKQKNSSLL